MDKQNLDRLRQKYGNAEGGDVFDPHFATIAAQQFKGGSKRKWPFAGLPTLIGAPYHPLGDDDAVLQDLDIGLYGVPMDLGVTNRSGARFGPRAVRQVERIGPMDHALGITPLARSVLADLGDVPMSSRYDLAQCHAEIEAYIDRLVKADVMPLGVGGDHSISLSILRALGRNKPVGMVHIDAHCDTSGAYEGAKFHHGGPFRLAVLDGVLDPQRTIQIGIRGGAEYLWEFSFDSGMTVIHADEVDRMGLDAVIAKALDVIGDGPTYVSFDVDSLDPAFTPGTGTPEVGGLTPREALAIIRSLQGRNIVGADVVEVAPQYDATTNTAQVAAQVLFTLACLLSANPRRVPKAER